MVPNNWRRKGWPRFPWPGAAALAVALVTLPLSADQAAVEQGKRTAEAGLAAPLKRQLETAELVARVEITAVQRLIDHALSEPGMTAVTGYVYSGVAQQVWKGASAAHLAFRVHLADCQEKLTRGQQYLIFARTNARGYLELLSCEAAIAHPERGNLLAELNRYY